MMRPVELDTNKLEDLIQSVRVSADIADHFVFELNAAEGQMAAISRAFHAVSHARDQAEELYRFFHGRGFGE